jgi:CO dehydrogenase maturation factor
VAILAKEFQRWGKQLIVVDSDESNSGLHWMLGIKNPPKPLVEFLGGKQNIQDGMTTESDKQSEDQRQSIWRQDEITIDDIPLAQTEGSENCRLVVIGKIGRLFEGCACTMGVVVREFLKKLRITPNQMVLVDMEAGIEHFGRGIESSIDAVIVVVEPSLESLSIAEKTKELTELSCARFAGAVINKTRSESDQIHLVQELKRRNIIELGGLRFYEGLFKRGLAGLPVNEALAGEESFAIADRLVNYLIKRREGRIADWW